MDAAVVVLWLVSVLVVGLLALPVAAWVFPRGDHGAYAVTVGIVVLGVVGHLIGHIAYRLPALLAGLGAIGLLAAIAYPRVDIDWHRFGVAVLVFVAAFAFVIILRLASPSAGTNPHWVGEMFLDLGLVSALERAPALPPEDMWFAGESVRYHYGGHLLTSLLAGLTGTPPAYAYNLGLATFFGALVTMAWGVAGSIARPMAISNRLAAAVGAFFVAFAGNLDTALRMVAWLLPSRLVESLATVVGADPAIANWQPGDFFYWDTSRVIFREGMIQETATEFPLFSWIHGDLHAHVLVKPVLLLVVAIAVAYWYTPPTHRRRRLGLLLVALPPVAGLVGVINMWSVPVVIGFTAVALVFAPGHPLGVIVPSMTDRLETAVAHQWGDDGRSALLGRIALLEGTRITAAVMLAGVVAAMSIGWTLPYWLEVVLTGPEESISTWSAGTGIGEFLIVKGAFIVGFVLYLGIRLTAVSGRITGIVGGFAVGLVVLAVVGWLVLGLVAGLLVLAWWLLRVDVEASTPSAEMARDSRLGPETMLIIAGLGIVLLVELIKLEGDTFNSVFKPYADIWQLWGVALGVVVVRLAGDWPGSLTPPELPHWRTVGSVVVVILVLSTGLYGALAIPGHLDAGNSWSSASTDVREEAGLTLDATAYVDVLYPGEAAAIAWLDELEGTPTIVTGTPAGYWWTPAEGEGAAAPASLTGLPTVLGWDGHQAQYRGDVVDDRRTAVADIYTGSPEVQRELLEVYDVEYIYVGPAEQARWSSITIDELEEVTVAVSFDAVTIYAVEQDT